MSENAQDKNNRQDSPSFQMQTLTPQRNLKGTPTKEEPADFRTIEPQYKIAVPGYN